VTTYYTTFILLRQYINFKNLIYFSYLYQKNFLNKDLKSFNNDFSKIFTLVSFIIL